MNVNRSDLFTARKRNDLGLRRPSSAIHISRSRHEEYNSRKKPERASRKMFPSIKGQTNDLPDPAHLNTLLSKQKDLIRDIHALKLKLLTTHEKDTATSKPKENIELLLARYCSSTEVGHLQHSIHSLHASMSEHAKSLISVARRQIGHTEQHVLSAGEVNRNNNCFRPTQSLSKKAPIQMYPADKLHPVDYSGDLMSVTIPVNELLQVVEKAQDVALAHKKEQSRNSELESSLHILNMRCKDMQEKYSLVCQAMKKSKNENDLHGSNSIVWRITSLTEQLEQKTQQVRSLEEKLSAEGISSLPPKQSLERYPQQVLSASITSTENINQSEELSEANAFPEESADVHETITEPPMDPTEICTSENASEQVTPSIDGTTSHLQNDDLNLAQETNVARECKPVMCQTEITLPVHQGAKEIRNQVAVLEEKLENAESALVLQAQKNERETAVWQLTKATLESRVHELSALLEESKQTVEKHEQKRSRTDVATETIESPKQHSSHAGSTSQELVPVIAVAKAMSKRLELQLKLLKVIPKYDDTRVRGEMSIQEWKELHMRWKQLERDCIRENNTLHILSNEVETETEQKPPINDNEILDRVARLQYERAQWESKAIESEETVAKLKLSHRDKVNQLVERIKRLESICGRRRERPRPWSASVGPKPRREPNSFSSLQRRVQHAPTKGTRITPKQNMNQQNANEREENPLPPSLPRNGPNGSFSSTAYSEIAGELETSSSTWNRVEGNGNPSKYRIPQHLLQEPCGSSSVKQLPESSIHKENT